MAFGRAGFAWIEAALSRCGHKPPPVAGGLATLADVTWAAAYG